jgi:hypothetical protein
MDSSKMTPGGWGLLWQILWDYLSPDERDALTGQTIAWLEGHLQLSEWNFIWQKLWAHQTGDEWLKELANEWLAKHADSLGWSFVFHRLYDAGVRDDWMLDRGMEGLANSPVTVADKYLWPKVESLEPAPDLFLYNLTKRLCRANIAFLHDEGAKLVASRLPDVRIEPVLQALHQSMDEPGWAYLLQGLLDHVESHRSVDIALLLQVGRDWLEGRDDQPEWNYVWQRLVDEFSDDATLLRQGREWLTGREGRPDYPFVTRKLDQLSRPQTPAQCPGVKFRPPKR